MKQVAHSSEEASVGGKFLHCINDCMARQKASYHHRSPAEPCAVVIPSSCVVKKQTKNSTDPTSDDAIHDHIKDMSQTIRRQVVEQIKIRQQKLVWYLMNVLGM